MWPYSPLGGGQKVRLYTALGKAMTSYKGSTATNKMSCILGESRLQHTKGKMSIVMYFFFLRCMNW